MPGWGSLSGAIWKPPEHFIRLVRRRPTTSEKAYFANDFVWHVPGDTDLSGDYSGNAYFVEIPARMQPLEEWHFDLESLAANQDLVVSVGRIRGSRLGRTLDAIAGHVLRFDAEARIVEAWGWCADQSALDTFFGQP